MPRGRRRATPACEQSTEVQYEEPKITLTVKTLKDLLSLVAPVRVDNSQPTVKPSLATSTLHSESRFAALSEHQTRLTEALQAILRIRSDLHHLGENVNFLVTTNLEILQHLREIRLNCPNSEVSKNEKVLVEEGNCLPL